jgi:hypothetical protein
MRIGVFGGTLTLVPKLCLGTRVRETPFRVRAAVGATARATPRNGVSRTRVPKQSLGTRR